MSGLFASFAPYPSGSAAAPSITFAGNTTTGLFNLGSNSCGLASGGVHRVTLDDTAAPLKEVYSSVFRPVVTSADIGSSPNQLSLNYMLGRLAFMNELQNLRPSSTAPASSLEINFEYVSDTSLKVRMRGSDGTVRSATLTLS